MAAVTRIELNLDHLLTAELRERRAGASQNRDDVTDDESCERKGGHLPSTKGHARGYTAGPHQALTDHARRRTHQTHRWESTQSAPKNAGNMKV